MTISNRGARNAEERDRRRNSGAVLAEGTAATVMFVLTAIVILCGCVNIWLYMTNTEKLRMAAQSAARIYANQRILYNAMLLPESQEPEAKQNAVDAAKYICRQLGIPGTPTVEVTLEKPGQYVLSKCVITANCILPFAEGTLLGSRVYSLFPGVIQVVAFDGVGFGKARLARMTVPNRRSNMPTGDLNMGNFVGGNRYHLCVNFPIFSYDEQVIGDTMTPPIADPAHNLDLGSFPAGCNDGYLPGFNLLGLGYQPGSGDNNRVIPPP